jgi:hypothetical protein
MPTITPVIGKSSNLPSNAALAVLAAALEMFSKERAAKEDQVRYDAALREMRETFSFEIK